MAENNKEKPPSQLRKDLVSGTWVVFSTKRRDKPDFYKEDKPVAKENKQDFENCPFCKTNIAKQEKDVLIYLKDNGEWSLKVFPNKFPVFSSAIKSVNKREEGPFELMDGAGYNEVLVTEDHQKDLPDLETPQVAEIIDAFQERYIALMNKKNVKYISIFKNYGRKAGASVSHPHCQIMAMPIIDPDVFRSLSGSEKYFAQNKECVHCVMIAWEKEKGERVIFENEDYIIVCPFVSRVSFEIRVYPKRHFSYYERITDEQKLKLAEAIKYCLSKLKLNLNDPAYNLFLHTSPCDGRTYDHYHWHFEIFPKTNIWAGFELSTGVEICSMLPEEAAKILRQ